MEKNMRGLFVGDLVGESGLTLLARWLPTLTAKHNIDFVVVNGENVALNGRGITPTEVVKMKNLGVSTITTGNHIWAKKEIYSYLEKESLLIRPANFPETCPGFGYRIFTVNGVSIGVINLMGRVFFRENLACPFKAAESIIEKLRLTCQAIFIDFHAEATSEKQALAFFLDGKVTGIVGTHTHVQTNDARVLPKGTAYMSDLGCCSAINSSCLGMRSDEIIRQFLTQMPERFVVQTAPPYQLSGAWIEFDVKTGKAITIEAIRLIDETSCA